MQASNLKRRLAGCILLADCAVFLESLAVRGFGTVVISKSLVDVAQTATCPGSFAAEAHARVRARTELVVHVPQILEKSRRLGRDDRLRAVRGCCGDRPRLTDRI